MPRIQKTDPRVPTPGTELDLAALDLRLDVPVVRWDRRIAALVREFRSHSTRIAVPDSPILANFHSTQVSWPNLFETQVRQLPFMDRAEEFRMARRYEFQKARVRDALARAGYPRAELGELVLRPVHALPPLKRAAAPAARAHLEQTISELERLRNVYVEGALYLIFAPVRRYRDLGVDGSDLVQEAAASLFQAIDGFDWRREVRFKTYAVYWIQQAILKTLYNASRTVRVPIWVQKVFRKIRRVQERALVENGALPATSSIAAELDLPVERVEEILAVRRFAVSLDATPARDDDGPTLGGSLADDSLRPVHETVQEGDLGVELRQLLTTLPDREQVILTRRFGLAGREPETLAAIAKDLGVTAERIRQLQKAAIERLQGPEAMGRLKLFT